MAPKVANGMENIDRCDDSNSVMEPQVLNSDARRYLGSQMAMTGSF